MASTLTLSSKFDDAEFTAYHVAQEGQRKGGLIVLQEIFGVDQYIKDDCERWSKLGFEALAPSLFDRQERGFVAEHTPDGLRQGLTYAQAVGLDNATADVETCVDWLGLRGPVFVVGYCYGGSLAYIAACRIGDLAASSSYYGSLVAANAGTQPLCPTICHFGNQDQHIAMSQVEAIRARRPDVPVYDYDAGHGFNNQGAAAYDHKAATLARKRTLELFERNGAA